MSDPVVLPSDEERRLVLSGLNYTERAELDCLLQEKAWEGQAREERELMGKNRIDQDFIKCSKVSTHPTRFW